MLSTDAQVRKLMAEMKKHGRVGIAATRAGMDRKTARKYLAAEKLPSELKKPRDWRTRKDPFEIDWPDIVLMLEDAPELEAKTVFEDLMARRLRVPDHRDHRFRPMPITDSGPSRSSIPEHADR